MSFSEFSCTDLEKIPSAPDGDEYHAVGVEGITTLTVFRGVSRKFQILTWRKPSGTRW
jgi:hypothetical protein